MQEDELEDELSKCKNYMSYFIERYCKLLTPNGIEDIRLSASQKKYLEYLDKHRRDDTRRNT
jgi:hypothetical protein